MKLNSPVPCKNCVTISMCRNKKYIKCEFLYMWLINNIGSAHVTIDFTYDDRLRGVKEGLEILLNFPDIEITCIEYYYDFIFYLSVSVGTTEYTIIIEK